MKLLHTIWKRWLAFGKIIGNIQSQIFLTVIYFLILWIIGIFVRISSDKLNIKKKSRNSNFSLWEHPFEGVQQAQQQY
jgi:hypothetical protein